MQRLQCNLYTYQTHIVVPQDILMLHHRMWGTLKLFKVNYAYGMFLFKTNQPSILINYYHVYQHH